MNNFGKERRMILTFSILALIISLSSATIFINEAINFRNQLLANQREINLLATRLNQIERGQRCNLAGSYTYDFIVPVNAGTSQNLPHVQLGNEIELQIRLMSGIHTNGTLLVFISDLSPLVAFQNGSFVGINGQPAQNPYSIKLIAVTHFGVPFGSATTQDLIFTVPFQGQLGIQVNNDGFSPLNLEVTVGGPSYCTG